MGYFNPASFGGLTFETETQTLAVFSQQPEKEALIYPSRVKPEERLDRSKNMFLHRTFYSFLPTNPLERIGERSLQSDDR